MLSVICPIFNEEKCIVECIHSIIGQTFPKNELQVLLVDGMSTDKTREIIKEYEQKYSFIRLIDNPEKTVPFAMNRAIREAKGDYIIRLDAHSVYPQNYFRELISWHEKLGDMAWNVGCVCETRPQEYNKESVAIAKVMSDKFGVGNSKFRIGSDEECVETDTVPFGCFKRFVFERVGMYNEKLTRIQDLELNRRIVAAGGKIYMISSTKCVYFPRQSYGSFSSNRFMTGRWVVKTLFVTKKFSDLGLRRFVPMIFVLGVFVPLLLTFFLWPFLLLTLLVLLAYTLCVVYRSCKLCDENTDLWHLIAAFFCIHFSFGFGSIVGLFDVLFGKNK